ncbi:hypothetical protein D3C72_2112390 [compost metagenome]
MPPFLSGLIRYTVRMKRAGTRDSRPSMPNTAIRVTPPAASVTSLNTARPTAIRNITTPNHCSPWAQRKRGDWRISRRWRLDSFSSVISTSSETFPFSA